MHYQGSTVHSYSPIVSNWIVEFSLWGWGWGGGEKTCLTPTTLHTAGSSDPVCPIPPKLPSQHQLTEERLAHFLHYTIGKYFIHYHVIFLRAGIMSIPLTTVFLELAKCLAWVVTQKTFAEWMNIELITYLVKLFSRDKMHRYWRYILIP